MPALRGGDLLLANWTPPPPGAWPLSLDGKLPQPQPPGISVGWGRQDGRDLGFSRSLREGAAAAGPGREGREGVASRPPTAEGSRGRPLPGLRAGAPTRSQSQRLREAWMLGPKI